ncbi:MAG: YlmC/YmxH family sporulation protein [Lachnospiraceae bacterium]
MRLSELKYKEVINECTCKKLGYIMDVNFNQTTGQICEVIIPEGCKGFNFFSKDGEYIIPYKCIRQIGPDIVLVEVDEKAVLKG